MTNKKKLAAILAVAMMVSQAGVLAQEVQQESVSGGEVTVRPWFIAHISNLW